jgi:hypothetical protein
MHQSSKSSSEPCASQLLRRDGAGEQQIDSRKYTERVRGLINDSIDAIAATDNERRDVLQRWRLPEALGVRQSNVWHV